MKRWKKALAAFAVASVMCFSMAAVGCGDKDDKGGNTGNNTQQGDTGNGGNTGTGGNEGNTGTGGNEGNTGTGGNEGNTGTTATVTSVTVTAAGNVTEVEVNKTLQLSVAVAGTNSPAQTVTWSSSDDTKATVSDAGLVTGKVAGSVTITATSTVDTTKKGTITLTVKAASTDNPPATSSAVTINVDDLTSFAADGETPLKEGVGIYALPEIQRDSSSRKLIYKGEEVSVSNRLKFGGSGTTSKKSLKVNLDKDATVVVYGANGTSGKASYLHMLDADGEEVANSTQQVNHKDDGKVAGAAMFEVKANTEYYITSVTVNDSANATVSYIAVVYGTFDETFTDVQAKANSCTEDGNIAYSVSNYGRYKNASGSIVFANDVALAKKGHDYEAKEIVAASATQTGSAKLICKNDNSHVIPVTLPVLTSGDYVERPEVGETGTYKYVSNGVEITFQAVGVAAASYKFETRYSNLFDTAIASIGYGAANANQLASGLKIYGSASPKASGAEKPTDYPTSIGASITSSKRLELKDDEEANTGYVYMVFDEAKTSGVYKISGTLHMPTQNGSWSIFQLISSEVDTDAAFAQIRSDSDKYLGMSALNSNEDVKSKTKSPYTKATDITFEIVLDLDASTVTLKIGSEEILTSANAMSVTVGANGWKGIRLQTASGKRNVYLSNLVIAERVVSSD